MEQGEITNEIICDNILRKFEGNFTYAHASIRQRDFYANIDPDYTIVEDHINFLLRDNTLRETDSGLALTTKGWFILTNADRVGYVARRIESVRKEQVERETRALFRWTTVIVGFVLMGWLAYKVIHPEILF
jgi:hypothetical protein